MLTNPGFALTRLQSPAGTAAATALAGEMVCLVITLLNCAERSEIEAGLVLRVTPPLPADVLAGLAGLDPQKVEVLLEFLLAAGYVARRRQRLVLAQPRALYRLALGAAPE